MAFPTFARSASLALAAALLAAPVFAQAPAPQPARPPAPAAAPAPALGPATIPIPQATPGHIGAARDIVQNSGMRRLFSASIPDLMRQMNGTVTRTRPELTADMKTAMEKLEPQFQKYSEEMSEQAARIYTALLNEQECKDAAAFFRSPVGVKFVSVQPDVFANMGEIMEPWTRSVSQRMYELTREEMKKKGHQI